MEGFAFPNTSPICSTYFFRSQSIAGALVCFSLSGLCNIPDIEAQISIYSCSEMLMHPLHRLHRTILQGCTDGGRYYDRTARKTRSSLFADGVHMNKILTDASAESRS